MAVAAHPPSDLAEPGGTSGDAGVDAVAGHPPDCAGVDAGGAPPGDPSPVTPPSGLGADIAATRAAADVVRGGCGLDAAAGGA
jgi:hypothetical protein